MSLNFKSFLQHQFNLGVSPCACCDNVIRAPVVCPEQKGKVPLAESPEDIFLRYGALKAL